MLLTIFEQTRQVCQVRLDRFAEIPDQTKQLPRDHEAVVQGMKLLVPIAQHFCAGELERDELKKARDKALGVKTVVGKTKKSPKVAPKSALKKKKVGKVTSPKKVQKKVTFADKDDAAKTKDDAAKTKGDAAKTKDDAAKTNGVKKRPAAAPAAAKTKDDAAKTKDDAAKTKDDATKANGVKKRPAAAPAAAPAVAKKAVTAKNVASKLEFVMPPPPDCCFDDALAV